MKKSDITYFEIIEPGDEIKVVCTRNEKIISERYCLTREHAEIVRMRFVNEFWGYRLN